MAEDYNAHGMNKRDLFLFPDQLRVDEARVVVFRGVRRLGYTHSTTPEDVMTALFETFWFTLLQHFAASLAIPVLVGHFCRPRRWWGRITILIICFTLLWVLWTSLLSIQVDTHLALLVAFVAVYAFIRSVARIQQSLPSMFDGDDEYEDEEERHEVPEPEAPEQNQNQARR